MNLPLRRVHPVFLWLLAVVLLLSTDFRSLAAPRKPNLVFILADDMGWADAGCYGNQFNETPNIDRLARQGMRFTDAYAACPVCSPTRASIMSGQYQARFGLTDFIPGHWRPFEKLIVPPVAPNLPLEIVTVAEALKPAGYKTAHFGKWHLGGREYYPDKQGFDKSIVTGGRYFAPRFKTEPKTPVKPGTVREDFLTDQTIQFLEENRDTPMFIYLCYQSVHIPIEATAKAIQKYEAKPKVAGYPCNPVYAAMTEDMDRDVGRLMAALDRLKLAEDTVLIFFSDNGGLTRRYDGGGEVVTVNTPLRGEKGMLYEGGVREPLIVRWPGKVKAGSTSRVPVISVDFYPTFLELAGARPPEQVLDGESLVPVLTQTGSLKPRALYWHYPHYHHSRPGGAIRQGDYKLIEYFDTKQVELYDLAADLGEAQDLATQLPGKAKDLLGELHGWQKRVNAQMPTPNPKYDSQQASQFWDRRKNQPILPATLDKAFK